MHACIACSIILWFAASACARAYLVLWSTPSIKFGMMAAISKQKAGGKEWCVPFIGDDDWWGEVSYGTQVAASEFRPSMQGQRQGKQDFFCLSRIHAAQWCLKLGTSVYKGLFGRAPSNSWLLVEKWFYADFVKWLIIWNELEGWEVKELNSSFTLCA